MNRADRDVGHHSELNLLPDREVSAVTQLSDLISSSFLNCSWVASSCSILCIKVWPMDELKCESRFLPTEGIVSIAAQVSKALRQDTTS